MKTGLLTFILGLSCIPFLYGQLPEGFVQELLVDGLDPTGMVEAPDGRIFITEKSGRIRILRDDALLEVPFLEIEVDNKNERGLQSMVLDPDFEFNNYFYLFYTVPGINKSRISRFTANGDVVLAGSEQVLFELDVLFGTVHNGGGMHISSDGKLLASVGDGGYASQAGDLNALGGKFLRLNLDGSIPEDNPFYEQLEGKARAIYAYGFRNTYGWAIDPVSGTILANDVGSDKWEEINRIEKGMFYGWDLVEGPSGGEVEEARYMDPFYAYNRNMGCAVTLSTFYRGPSTGFPERYQGKYFFGDYCAGNIWVLNPETAEIEEIFLTGLDRPISGLVSLRDGAFYYLVRPGLNNGSVEDNTATGSGELWRVSYVGDGKPFIGRQPQPKLVPLGEEALFTVQVSGTPPFHYQWWLNGDPVMGADSSVLSLPVNDLSLDQSEIFCRVSNELGDAVSDTILLSVTTNQRPVPLISSPSEGLTYEAGDIIRFEGGAEDPEEGSLPAEKLGWRIDFHHDEHTHPALSYTPGVFSGAYEIPAVGEIDTNVWYRIYLTVEDQQGLQATTYRELYPKKVNYFLRTEPAGFELEIDGNRLPEPQQVGSVKGIIRAALAPLFQFRGDSIFYFDQWDNGQTDPILTFPAGAFQEATAVYRGYRPQYGNGQGLTGTYYNHQWQSTPFAEEILTRVDTVISFDWQTSSPAPGEIQEDNFSIRWTGSIEPVVSGPYTFHLQADEAVRLKINEQLLVDTWDQDINREVTGTIQLEYGKRYPILIEYKEDWWKAAIRLDWSSPKFPRTTVPRSQLFPEMVSPVDQGPQADSIRTISLYPNPSGPVDPVLSISSPEEDEIQWRLLTLHGAVLSSGRNFLSPGENLLDLPTAQLPPGLYLITLKSLDNDWQEHLRMVKQ